MIRSELSPAEWLQNVRKDLGYNKRFSMPWKQIKEYINRLPKEEQKRATDVWRKRYSQTYGNIHDNQMNSYCKVLMSVLEEDQRKFMNSVFFGVYPTGEFTGYSDKMEKGHRVIILHEGLCYTIHFLSSLYFRIYEDGLESFIEGRNPELLKAVLWIKSIWDGQEPAVSLPDIFPKNKDSWELSSSLTAAALIFVLSHELGHAFLNHPEYGPRMQDNHKIEYEADRFALRTILRYSIMISFAKDDTYHTQASLFAPYFLCSVFSMFGVDASKSHPSPRARMLRISRIIEEELIDLIGEPRFRLFKKDMGSDIFDLLKTNGMGLMEVMSAFAPEKRSRRDNSKLIALLQNL